MRDARPADKRESNLELLRIIMMVLIVAHHFAYHGGFEYPWQTVSLNRLWIQLMMIGGKLGVDVFVLISGYFLINAERLKTVRPVRMWFQLLTYSLVPFCLLAATGQVRFTAERLLHSLLPIAYDGWWFASAYFILYLFAPFINRFLRAMDRNEYRRFLLILMTVWCVIPTFLHVEMQRNNLLWFFCLYCVIGYYRLHHRSTGRKGSSCILLALAILLGIFGSAAALDLIGRNNRFIADHAMFFYDYYSLPVLAAAMLLVTGFSRIRMKRSRLINTISAAMFGVYLIHDNSYLRKLIWEKIFRTSAYADSSALIPYSAGVVLLVFIACTAIELIRIHTLEKSCGGLYALIADRADSLTERILSGRKSGGEAPDADRRGERPEGGTDGDQD